MVGCVTPMKPSAVFRYGADGKALPLDILVLLESLPWLQEEALHLESFPGMARLMVLSLFVFPFWGEHLKSLSVDSWEQQNTVDEIWTEAAPCLFQKRKTVSPKLLVSLSGHDLCGHSRASL